MSQGRESLDDYHWARFLVPIGLAERGTAYRLGLDVRQADGRPAGAGRRRKQPRESRRLARTRPSRRFFCGCFLRELPRMGPRGKNRRSFCPVGRSEHIAAVEREARPARSGPSIRTGRPATCVWGRSRQSRSGTEVASYVRCETAARTSADHAGGLFARGSPLSWRPKREFGEAEASETPTPP